MLEGLGDLNWLAVVVAAVVYFALGALWYSPVLFAKPWMAAAGVDPQRADTNYAVLFGGSFLGYLVISIGLGLFVRALGATTIGDGLEIGLIAGIAFSATTTAINNAYEGRPLALFLINAGYNILGFGIAGALLASWQ